MSPNPEFAELLGTLATNARDGDRGALEQLIGGIYDDIYRLALRMTGLPDDAEDATQEILLKVVTHLSTWRGDARITTWTHRIAVNHLLDRKRSTLERHPLSFDEFAADLTDGLGPATLTRHSYDPDLLDEVRLGCTMAMLQCLDRDHRIAYILGELFDISGDDGAWICGISPTTFRKRVSRARTKVRAFVSQHCGLVSKTAACCCERRVETAITKRRLDPTNLQRAQHPVSSVGELRRTADAIDDLRDHVRELRNHPDYAAPRQLVAAAMGIIEHSPLLPTADVTPSGTGPA